MREELENIKRIRYENNDLWMKILDIALTHAPKETKEILKEVQINDLLVTHQLMDIIDEDSQA